MRKRQRTWTDARIAVWGRKLENSAMRFRVFIRRPLPNAPDAAASCRRPRRLDQRQVVQTRSRARRRRKPLMLLDVVLQSGCKVHGAKLDTIERPGRENENKRLPRISYVRQQERLALCRIE